MSYNSKYTGQQVEETLDAVKDKVDKVDANNMYQPKGDYASSDELQGVQDTIEKLSEDIKDIADSDIKWNDVK